MQQTWDRWQTFNAGALAFLASLVAFNISRLSETRQREYDFIAARSFLPATLSELMEYCSQSALVYDVFWNSAGTTPLNLTGPSLPADYRETFRECIRSADPQVAAYLATILVRLQIHDARLRDAISEANSDASHILGRPN